MQRLHHKEKDGEKIDEPQRGIRIDEAPGISRQDLRRRGAAIKARCLEGKLDRHPQHIEIDKVEELAIQIGAPWTIDAARQKESRQHEEIRHAERARPFDKAMQPALEPERVFDTEGRMHENNKDDAN